MYQNNILTSIATMGVELVLVSTAAVLVFFHFLRNHLSHWRSCSKEASSTAVPRVSPCLPLLGNALQLGTTPFHHFLSSLTQQYGPVFSIRLFQQDIVVLNDYASIHDALIIKGSDFAGRPPTYRTSVRNRHKQSIVWQTYTHKLVFLRKWVLKALRVFSAGSGALEERCRPDIQRMCQAMAATKGEAFDPSVVIYDAVCNVMLCLLTGSQQDQTDSSVQHIKRINTLFNDTFGSGRAHRLDFVPWLKYLRSDQYQRMREALRLRDEFWEDQLAKLRNSEGDPQSVVRSLLIEADANAQNTTTTTITNNNTTKKKKNGEVLTASSILPREANHHRTDVIIDTVKEVFTNLMLAGTDTTATTLTCLLLILVHHPHIQDKLHQEVDATLGSAHPPALADRPLLPFLEATLLELLRYISHVPLAVPHYTTCDTSVLNKHIPANTTVYINLWALHHNKNHWTDPWHFKPSRFLDDQGNLVPPSHENRRKLLAFGAGRRVCLGEVLAKHRLFLFSASLLQQFRFEAETSDELPPVDPRSYEMGLVLHPQPFKVRAIPRNVHLS